MPRQIFVNICVSDIAAATSFYETIGATKNTMFSDETTSCMVFSEAIHVMIMLPGTFKKFTPAEKQVADSKKTTEVLLCISVERKDEVDDIISTAVKSGGKADPTTLPQMPGMYGRSFEDPDGHVWELMWMDTQACQDNWEAEKVKPQEKDEEKQA